MRQDFEPYIILLCMLSGTIQSRLCYIKQNKLGWERGFKEFGQNLRNFGCSKKEFRFQAVEALKFSIKIIWRFDWDAIMPADAQ